MIAVLAAAFSAVLAVLPLTPAYAQDGTDRPELAPTMLVLDGSGSMAGPDPAGGSKMDAAKRAVHTLVDAAPENATVGLAVYGTSTA